MLGKVKISGGGRCNVTHACFDPREFAERYPRGEKNLIGPLHRWGAAETMGWFEERGVALKTEEDGRVFPVSDDSQTVIDCLESAARSAGVEVRRHCEVESIGRAGEEWRVDLGSGETIRSRAVLLSTGGIRNGAGLRLAESVGHRVVPAAPSLFTFRITDPRIEGLSGISVEDVEISVPGTSLRERGPCLVTHWGLSGPAVLRVSAWGARELEERAYRFPVRIDWCPGRPVDGVLRECRESHPKRLVRSPVESLAIPQRLWARLVDAAGVGGDTTWSNLSKARRESLGREIAAGEFAVEGKSMNKDEFVTAGGIDLREVDFRTMESRLVPGLYFAGEVLDVDGITGGFNFQAAWTTSRIAGEAAAATGAG